VEADRPPSLYTEEDGWQPLSIWGMGIAAHDVTGDGLPEVVLTSQGDNKMQTLTDPSRPEYGDIAISLGTTAHRPFMGDATLPSTAWHPEFADVNNDGLVDLFLSKGNVDSQVDHAAADPSNLLLATADGTFVERAREAGVVSLGLGRGAALVDLNLDGLLDLVEVQREENVRLWRNTGDGSGGPLGRWVALRLEPAGCEPGRDRLVGAGAHRRGHGPPAGDDRRRPRRRSARVAARRSRFGVDGAEVQVQWPDGEQGPWLPVEVDQFVVVERGPTNRCRGLRCREEGCMRTRRASLTRLPLPEFGMPTHEPLIPAPVYLTRLERLRARAAGRGYDRVVVYADREHSASMSYLSGFDPRFEEAVLVLGPDGEPAMLVGNECFAPAGAAAVPLRRQLYQELSLPSQPRDRSASLGEILSGEGIGAGSRSASWAGSSTPTDASSTCPPSSSTGCAPLVGRPAWWRTPPTC
jgi:hypothetical protein